MTGIETICNKIRTDAQSQCDDILNRARQEAAEIEKTYEDSAQSDAQAILSRGRAAAAERQVRLKGVAELEARKLSLAAKQQMLDAAFDAALQELQNLPEQEYISTLAALAAKSAVTGSEEIILSSGDREKYGRQIVAAANRLFSEAHPGPSFQEKARDAFNELTPKADAPQDLKSLGKKVLSATGKLMASAPALTLSDETRDTQGGLILQGDRMEVNATFPAILRKLRDELSIQVAQILFE